MIRDSEILMAEIFVISQVNGVFRGVTNITNFSQILFRSVWEDEVTTGWASLWWAAVRGLKRILMDGWGTPDCFPRETRAQLFKLSYCCPTTTAASWKWKGGETNAQPDSFPSGRRDLDGLGTALCWCVWTEVGNNLMPHPLPYSHLHPHS